MYRPERTYRSSAPAVCLLLAALFSLIPATVGAIVPAQGDSPLSRLAFISDRLQAGPVLAPVEEVEANLAPQVRTGWNDFRSASGQWTAVIDKRSGRLEIAEGEGIPFLPGSGNQLTRGDIAAHLNGKTEVDLATVESIARAFLPRVAPLLGIDPKALVLNTGRSGHPSEHIWYADFDLKRDGLIIEGARVVFRISHGNLTQLGTENLPSAGAVAPRTEVTREQALANLAAYVGGFSAADRFLDGGSLHMLPVQIKDERFNEGFEVGNGRGLTPAWEFTFRRDKQAETWRARVDAATGEMLELVDRNDYAQVTGGSNFLGVPSNVPMPFADVTPGGPANSAGIYSYGGGVATSTLNGPYVRINDNCGPISLAADALGAIAFGTSAGTDCTTPGVGGTGNTRSARTQFYHLNRTKEVARGWLPGVAWLGQKLVANVNINLTCNAFWDGSSVNFYRSGGGCNNTGEIEAVSLHEYGHGLDTNDGNGSPPDRGTGETYGDWTAALATHSSCIGAGFRASNCGGYSNACTACTGVRDIDWAKHTANLAHTVDNFTRPNCPTSATYLGPCGKEGHCESYISSESLWDFVNRDLPAPGSGTAWTIGERLWYLSRSTATGAFACTAGATYTSNGCNTGSAWKTLRFVDDDDGNLANGTPNSAALFAAFNRHGIACTTDTGANVSFRGCTQPATPTLSLTPGDNQVTVSWSGSTGVYDVYRNEFGCNAGFTKIGNDVAASPIIDGDVANGFTYYYQIVSQPSGNESCGSAPSTCMSVTPTAGPCDPLSAPTALVAVGGASSINLTWNAVTGATSYRVYRSTTTGGPYGLVGTSATPSFSDTSVACQDVVPTYYYVVRAATSSSCESPNSAEATGARVCPPCTTQTVYTNNFETGTGLADWTSGTFVGGGSTANWRGIQTCTAQSGTKIFRFGGAGCTDDYTSNTFSFAQPNGAGGITIPAGSRNSRLSFQHRRSFESGFDGGVMTVSVDGTNYEVVPDSAILSGAHYDGVIDDACPPTGAAGAPAFTGTAASFAQTVVDLDAACDLASGGTGGCAGQAVRIGFTTVTDCSITSDGWFLDDVQVTSCVPSVPTVASDYFNLTPCRLIDTRLADGPLGGPVLQPGVERLFTVTGICGVPSTAKSLVLNVTVVNPASGGFLQAYPGDGSAPTTSTINFSTGQLLSNNAIVSLSSNGSGGLKLKPGTTGTVHVVVDVTGYFE